jgi:hypothetical protein
MCELEIPWEITRFECFSIARATIKVVIDNVLSSMLSQWSLLVGGHHLPLAVLVAEFYL